MNIRQNLFGQGQKAGRDQGGPAGYGRSPQLPPRDDTPMGGYQEDPRGQYGGGGYNAPPGGRPPQGMPQRPAVGRPPAQQRSARRIQMRIAKVEDKTLANQFIFGNL
jgi:vesicle-fusing ATPase